MLKKTKLNISYTIVGYGVLENDIRQFVKKENLEEKVNIVINPNNINHYYAKASVFLQSSIFEGMSNTLMEAMSFSLPIIATSVGDTNILVEEKINGYLCQPKNVNQIMEKLYLTISNKEKRLLLGQNSYDKIQNGFSLEVFSNKYINLIENL